MAATGFWLLARALVVRFVALRFVALDCRGTVRVRSVARVDETARTFPRRPPRRGPAWAISPKHRPGGAPSPNRKRIRPPPGRGLYSIRPNERCPCQAPSTTL